jgi:hypothetical protein
VNPVPAKFGVGPDSSLEFGDFAPRLGHQHSLDWEGFLLVLEIEFSFGDGTDIAFARVG